MSNVISLPQPSQSVFVLQVRPSPKPGAVKAYADIQYHKAIIKGLSVVAHNGGHFVGFPSTLGKDGKKRFPIVVFSEPERSQIANLVLDAAKEILQFYGIPCSPEIFGPGYSGGNVLTRSRWNGPAPQNYEAERRRRRLVKDQIAEMLEGYQWDWFSTYTVNMQAKPETVHTMFRNHLAFIEKRAGLPIYAFRGDEYGVLNGWYHIHALLGNVGDFQAYCGERLPARNPCDKPRPCCGVHSWPGGYARVFSYDPAISATGYVSKYVTKDFGDYELIGDFIPVTERQ